jgi:peptide/nickel transport system substrate-binding protein
MTDRQNTELGLATPLSRRRLLGYGAAALGGMTLAGTLAQAAEGRSSLLAASGKTIKIGISDFFSKDGLDPAQQVSTFGLMSSGMLHDTLVRLDEQWNVHPMLATDWSTNAKATSFTYKLRKGVVFPTSGKTLDANDVAWSIAHVLDKKTGSSGLSLFQPVLAKSGIKVVDPTTIRFDLKTPNVFFPILLGFWYGRISQANWDFKKGSGGTGPFKSKSYQGGQGFQLVRNEHYWQSGKPYLDGINGIVISEPATKTQSVLHGDTDMIDQPDFSTFAEFANAKNVTMLNGPYGYQMDFGIGGQIKPYSDPRVRQALKMALDRPKFVEVVCKGQALVCGDIPINPKDVFYPAGLKPPAYDPEKAKTLLKQAGYGGGFKDTVYTSPTFEGLNDSSVLLKEQWGQIGVDLSVASVSTDAWNTHFLKAGVLANYWARQHPSTMMPFMAGTGGAWNESHISDAKLDSLIVQARSTKSLAKQKDLYTEILLRYRDLSASIWPMTYKSFWPHSTKLSGVAFHPTDLVDFRNAKLAS